MFALQTPGPNAYAMMALYAPIFIAKFGFLVGTLMAFSLAYTFPH